MLYAGTIGKNPGISRHEIESAGANIIEQSGSIVFFEYQKKKEQQRAGMTKWGRVVTEEEAHKYIAHTQPKILGSNDKHLALQRKRQYNCIKRIKETKIIETDYDVKTKGREIIALPQDRYLLIDHYQNIPLYEAIDIHKPISGMEIGMMPSKLTHLLLNIGINTYEGLVPLMKGGVRRTGGSIPTIRDPFTGFGTTNMIANAMGYHTIGSDLNITQAKKNMTRRSDHDLATDHKITLRKHDVTDTFGPVFSHADVVVSEGRLGPIVTGKTHVPTLELHATKIATLYAAFFENIQKMGDKAPKTIVITIPEYDRYDGPQPRELLQKHSSFAHFSDSTSSLDEVYRRKKQRVGRRILILTLDNKKI